MTNKNVAEFKAKLLEKVSKDEAQKAIQIILKYIGENPNREGLLETPKRVIKAFDQYFSGYLENPQEYLEKTFGNVEGYDDMVIQKIYQFQVIVNITWLQ
jgi:GTP cyclohydrolase I